MWQKSVPVLEGQLEDLKSYFDGSNGGSMENVASALTGKATSKPSYRIPAADNGKDVFFTDREVLLRFADMPTPTQSAFLEAVRSAMRHQSTNVIHLSVQWSESKKRVLAIKEIDGTLDIDLI